MPKRDLHQGRNVAFAKDKAIHRGLVAHKKIEETMGICGLRVSAFYPIHHARRSQPTKVKFVSRSEAGNMADLSGADIFDQITRV
jgi:hypothetical protein